MDFSYDRPTAAICGRIRTLEFAGRGHALFMVNRLAQLMTEHMAMEFPSAIDKGLDYGEIDPVMIGADIYGWALGVSKGTPLNAVDRRRLQAAYGELIRSIDEIPAPARPYFEHLARLAEATLDHEPGT